MTWSDFFLRLRNERIWRSSAIISTFSISPSSFVNTFFNNWVCSLAVAPLSVTTRPTLPNLSIPGISRKWFTSGKFLNSNTFYYSSSGSPSSPQSTWLVSFLSSFFSSYLFSSSFCKKSSRVEAKFYPSGAPPPGASSSFSDTIDETSSSSLL